MILERLGHADRRIGDRYFRGGLLLGALDPLLDLPDVLEIIGEPRLVFRAETALQIFDVVFHRVEDAAIGLHVGQPLRARPRPAEHPLECHTRIDLHGQRRRRAGPGQRVHVCARVLRGAAANVPREVLRRELERGEHGVLADLLRDDLIDGLADVDVLRDGHLRDRAAQPGCDRARVSIQRVAQLGHDRHMIAKRLERLQNGSKVEIRACGLAAVLAIAVMAGTIDSSSGSASVTPMPRRNVRGGNAILVMNMVASSFS